MSILPLSQSVQAQLRSSIQISTLVDVVEGLVRNSLDAAATTLEVEVDFSKGFCSVGDNGVGIPSNEFRGGHLAQHGCTSKRNSPHVYGHQGCFLSDLSSLSLVSISSRQDGAQSAALLIGVLSGVPSRQQSVGHDDYLQSHGTRVVVHNLFGNLPVRFKHFALRYAQANEERRAFHSLERRLVSYLLASARPVNIRLRNRNGNLVYTHRAARSIGQTPATSFDLGPIESTFRQAGLVPKSGSAPWKLASAQAGGISIRAAVCLLPSPSKQGQFIAIDHHPLPSSGHLSPLYDAVNQLFDMSEFGALVDEESKTARSGARPTDYRQTHVKHKAVKGVDRWPRFYVRIDAKSSAMVDEICGAKADACQISIPIMAVIALLTSLFTAFLESQNLKPRAQRSQRNIISQSQRNIISQSQRNIISQSQRNIIPQSQSSGAARKLPAPSILDTWKRVKYSAYYEDPGIKHGMPFNSEDEPPVSEIVLGEDVRLLLGDMEFGPDEVCPSDHDSGGKSDPTPPNAADGEGTIQWTDPGTNKVVYINACNGFVVPCASSASSSGAEDKELLGQIDAKFILAVVRQDDSEPALLVIDQHAADERVKVEQLFLQLCVPEAVELAVPLNFEVTAEEQNRLLDMRDYFADWAIRFEIDRGKETISVTHLPSVIAERCRLEPRLLIDLVRKAVWSQDTSRSHTSAPSVDRGSKESWMSKLSRCPQGLVEMVNSRACRTAVMFNDVLGKEQCQTILRQLSACTFPFQCAHGRPSMTLLASFGSFRVGSSEERHDDEADRHQDFGTAYRKWCEATNTG
ncbi:hypothetical protein DV735_g2961, partial [Chaetothyriales sp. CBS 134920]